MKGVAYFKFLDNFDLSDEQWVKAFCLFSTMLSFVNITEQRRENKDLVGLIDYVER